MTELEKDMQSLYQVMSRRGFSEEAETIYRAAMEIQKLGEKARLYDEAVGQLPHGYFDTVHGQYYDDDFDQAAEDPNNECVPLYTKPVPQAMAVPDKYHAAVPIGHLDCVLSDMEAVIENAESARRWVKKFRGDE